MKVTFVYLTAGKPDLLVLKAVNAIRHADILVGKPELLCELTEYTAKSCVEVPDIAELSLVLDRFREKRFARIVRVLPGKYIGSDRLLRELRLFSHAGYETEVVPGVSPIQTAAAAARFPLTQRGCSQGFFVINCRHIAAGRLFEQVRIAAAATATLVLCGAGAYEEALLALIAEERGKDLLLHRGRVLIAARRSLASRHALGSFDRSDLSSLSFLPVDG